MISPRGGDVLLALVLILSLLLKISGATNAQVVGPGEVSDRVVAALERHGFKVTRNAADEDLFSLSGERGRCRLLVAVLSPHGWHRDVIRKIAPPDSQVLFVFDGVSYRDQPLLLTRVDYYWSRLLHFAGFNQPMRPVFGVVGSSECEHDDVLKWVDLVALPELGRAPVSGQGQARSAGQGSAPDTVGLDSLDQGHRAGPRSVHQLTGMSG